MMGSANMGAIMNKPLAEILQQLERDFGAAAQQAQQAQRRYPGQPSQPGDSSTERGSAMRLPVDTIETEDAIWYFADLPGLEKKDLQVCCTCEAMRCCCCSCIHHCSIAYTYVRSRRQHQGTTCSYPTSNHAHPHVSCSIVVSEQMLAFTEVHIGCTAFTSPLVHVACSNV